ncbi:AAA family ATPase [Streptomyces sp. NPDC059802]|uniref:AAA family ATPase n=1 Tax=Streptomyces sp. NPDC059802 TaxID=3346952 RepID=UPI0036621999
MTQLVSFKVDKLLGHFTHEVFFKDESEFVILHGPNGVGKTKMLELLEAVLKFDIFSIADSKFESIALRFSGGERLVVTNNATRKRVHSERHYADIDVTFSLIVRKGAAVTGNVKLNRTELPPSLWREIQSDISQSAEVDASPSAKLQALFHAGSGFAPPRYRGTRQLASHAGGIFNVDEFNTDIVEFLDKFSVHLVETQRLLILEAASDPRRRSASEQPQRMKVAECARDLARHLARALTDNSRKSQALDKSFPRRVLDEDVVPDTNRIREVYAEQSQLRNRLAAIALLDESMDVPLQGGELLEWQRKVLWTYLRDSQQKLDTFQDLLLRVELFKSIIGKRFLFKRMLIDREYGFRFESVADRQPIYPSQLSSGEQHEIVLVYDLLFKVKPGSLVLIDEPEISLHVAWQQEFISDIQRIAHLSKLRFVVATHSPQIINEWWSQTVGLRAPASLESGE